VELASGNPEVNEAIKFIPKKNLERIIDFQLDEYLVSLPNVSEGGLKWKQSG